MKNILCFGDSNTFGTNPKGGRHPRNVRWTGVLQRLLGEEYYVIEEGLGGRTTCGMIPMSRTDAVKRHCQLPCNPIDR